MIEILEGFPKTVIGLAARGQVTRADYEQVLIPLVEKAIAERSKVRVYYQLGTDFTGIDAGAAWEDFKLGMGHITAWERFAVVTDVGWIKTAISAFGFLIPGVIRVYPTAETEAARRWISEPA